MFENTFCNSKIVIDYQKACVETLVIDGICITAEPMPLFEIRMLDENGNKTVISAAEASLCRETEDGAIYSGFKTDITVNVKCKGDKLAVLGISIQNNTNMLVEYVKFPCISLKPLKGNGGVGRVLSAYNEGVIIDDINLREMSFRHHEPEYPSMGAYWMFPYMIGSQFTAYMTDNAGLYMGAHDSERAPKGIELTRSESGVSMCFRLFIGNGFGKDAECGFEIVLDSYKGSWHDAAEIYRAWLYDNLPKGAVKIKDNKKLPEWYSDLPLVLGYPVRGIHDMDEMYPNDLFPYCNALPIIKDISEKTGARIMALLMHWEGSAPWAPPYVWPPYGGEECFNEFKDALHKDGNLLGVYCSGFGYTLQSNLVDSYNMENELSEKGYLDAMCQSPEGKVGISRICTGQRSGYDICAASEKGREILLDAYTPLLKSGVDYSQILDQNHGGSQYFCYSRNHGHIPSPGAWMTSNMQNILGEWNDINPSMLMGCESAAAEPYIANLLLSDNRYEVNFMIGTPVPLYAYIYHEYLRNFMGNQVCCGLAHLRNGETIDTMRYRLAYSFVCGDLMTLVLTPKGNLMANWGNHDFEHVPNKEKALEFCRNMTTVYKNGLGSIIHGAKMIKPMEYSCDNVLFYGTDGREFYVPAVLSCAYDSGERKIQLFVNHTEQEHVVKTENGTAVTVPSHDAVYIDL